VHWPRRVRYEDVQRHRAVAEVFGDDGWPKGLPQCTEMGAVEIEERVEDDLASTAGSSRGRRLLPPTVQKDGLRLGGICR